MITKTLIVTGNGINCEVETAHAFQEAGSQTTILPLHDFLELKSFDDFNIIAFPGGFSYGDEIKSGKIVSERIKSKQFKNLKQFIDSGKPVIGICNGFQILLQLGLFNTEKNKQPITLSENKNKKFINEWIKLDISKMNSFWFSGMNSFLYMPIRHKEGRLRGDIPSQNHALTYQRDVNGSHNQLAALINTKGNVLGLMPHPEAAIHSFLLPQFKDKSVLNLKIFQNAVDYARSI